MAMMVLVTGLPGTGKTYFAERLATHLNAVHINSDKIRAALNLRGKYSYTSKEEVYDKMLENTIDALQNHQNVVVDSTFYQEATRRRFIDLAANMNCCWQILQITASDKTVKERVSQKREFSEANYEVYQHIKASYEAIKEPHFILNSDEMPVEQMIVQAKEYMHHDKIRYSRPYASTQRNDDFRVDRDAYFMGPHFREYSV
jgi:predicted kinase